MLRRHRLLHLLALAGVLAFIASISPAPSSADSASVTAVVARGNQSCALLSDGTVGCWGANDSGQLGDGTTADHTTPVGVSGLTTATQLAAGIRHTCALVSGGSIKCWGADTYGQLGDGSTTEENTPVNVSNITTATQIGAGDFHTCAVLSDGTIDCWGYNYYGQLGNGTGSGFSPNSTPGAVTGISTAVQVVGGQNFTCARLSGGTVDCWGQNSHGQLGDNSYSNSPTPVQVSGISTASSISAYGSTACAVLSDHTVECWGYGDMGNGSGAGDHLTPVAASGISTAVGVIVGLVHTCVWLSDGSAKCWGYNGYGELGDGTTTDELSPVSVSGVSSVAPMAAGDYHTCAVLSSSSIKCWGLNSHGQLGNDSTTNSSTPTSVFVVPAIVTAPAVTPTGTPQDGITLTVSSGTWFGSPTSYTYQWQSCSTNCSDITGATSSSYYPDASVYGLGLRAEVTATNSNGSTIVTTTTTNPVADRYQSRFSFYWLGGSSSTGGTQADVVVNSISPDSAGCLLFRSDVEDTQDAELIQAGLEECGPTATSDCGTRADTNLILFAEIHDSLGYTCHDDGIVLESYSYTTKVQKDSLGVWHAYPGGNNDTLTMNFTNPPNLFGESGEHGTGNLSNDCSGWSGSATFGANTPWQIYNTSTGTWTDVTSPYAISKGCWTTSGAPSQSFTISH